MAHLQIHLEAAARAAGPGPVTTAAQAFLSGGQGHVTQTAPQNRHLIPHLRAGGGGWETWAKATPFGLVLI